MKFGNFHYNIFEKFNFEVKNGGVNEDAIKEILSEIEDEMPEEESAKI
jgi:hypothetical protein